MELRSNGRNTPNELALMADQVGRFMQYWGFKKIHGRIWTHIYLSSIPLDAGTLMKRLRVSKALMSLSLHDLMDHGVIREAGKSERGTQVYVANPNIISLILSVLRSREKKMLLEIESAWRMLRNVSHSEVADAQLEVTRVENLGQLIHEAQGALDAILELSRVDFSRWGEIGKHGTLPTSLFPSPSRNSNP